MRLEVDSVENFSKGSPTDISDAHALLKVRNLLRKPNISATTDEIILHDLLLHYRRIYESLPATMKAKPEINANPLGLRHAEQFIVICGAFPCAARTSWHKACDFGFRGNLGEWERLLILLDHF
jgi:hypothetical protein